MHITIVTLFPEMFVGPLDFSILKRAREAGQVEINLINPRNFTTDKYQTVDDRPYGGGAGMILKVDVVDRAIEYVIRHKAKGKSKTILLDPQGVKYTQAKAKELASEENLILVCGHYEGVDERVRNLVDEEISIGDYILTGGEIPTLVIIDSVSRLLPGVLKKPGVTDDESFAKENKLLEYPQYTRPEIYKSKQVPQVLLSGHHAQIAKWKENQALLRTKKRRPDLL